jgi:hypothetical protein
MTLVDRLAYEYKWTLDTILSLSLAKALVLHAAILERREVKISAPTYAERDIIAQLHLS